MSLISDTPTMKPPGQSSRAQNTAVGGGARPTPSKIKTPSSAPGNPRSLDRWSNGDGDGKALK